MENFKMQIEELIKALGEKLVAKHLGVTTKTVYNYRKANKLPKILVIEKIAQMHTLWRSFLDCI